MWLPLPLDLGGAVLVDRILPEMQPWNPSDPVFSDFCAEHEEAKSLCGAGVTEQPNNDSDSLSCSCVLEGDGWH